MNPKADEDPEDRPLIAIEKFLEEAGRLDQAKPKPAVADEWSVAPVLVPLPVLRWSPFLYAFH